MSLTRGELLRPAGAVAGGSLHAANAPRSDDKRTPPSPRGVPGDLFDLFDFERAAKAQLTPMAWDYISGAAADELTLRWNHEAYEKLRLKPRILNDVSRLDTRIR